MPSPTPPFALPARLVGHASQRFDVIVLGAGAAGLQCAGVAGQRGKRVLVLDHADKLAEKIRISGGGRCNFTNTTVSAENYLSSNPHFVRSALAQYSQWDFIKPVEHAGIAYEERDHGQLFCLDSAGDIIQLLDHTCQAAGVTRHLGCPILAVEAAPEGQRGFWVETPHGVFGAPSLVVATGGLSIPAIGATPLGYRLAEQFGLAITPLRPALVPLTFDAAEQARFGGLAGVSLDAIVSCGKAQFREQVLFTHKGLSGPAILQISSYWQAGEAISLDLMPDQPIEARLAEAARSEQQLATVLAQVWPKRFAVEWMAQQALPNLPMRQLNARQLEAVPPAMRAWPLKPCGTQGYKKAEATCGGVDTAELSSKTMEARRVPGLFFIGEVVDVTGWLGGYNFQWAWSSGYAAGCAV